MKISSLKLNSKHLVSVITAVIFISISVFAFRLIGWPHSDSQTKREPSPQTIVTVSVTTTPTSFPTPTPFPSKHLIKTTFIPQAPEKNWDQPWQDACEEAALLTVAFYYQDSQPSQEDIVRSILDMINYETAHEFKKDVNIDQMALIATDYLNLETEIMLQPDLDKIKNYLVQDIPVIIPANGKQLFVENPNFANGGPYYHSLVILGYDDRKKQFTVHDVGTRRGAYFKYSYDLLLDSIHDFPPSKKKEDITQGDKKALILLK